jgi:hypothetical protein
MKTQTVIEAAKQVQDLTTRAHPDPEAFNAVMGVLALVVVFVLALAVLVWLCTGLVKAWKGGGAEGQPQQAQFVFHVGQQPSAAVVYMPPSAQQFRPLPRVRRRLRQGR